MEPIFFSNRLVYKQALIDLQVNEAQQFLSV